MDWNLKVSILEVYPGEEVVLPDVSRTEFGVSTLNGVCWTNSFRGERSITGRQPPEDA